jgi:hypothetical protein
MWHFVHIDVITYGLVRSILRVSVCLPLFYAPASYIYCYFPFGRLNISLCLYCTLKPFLRRTLYKQWQQASACIVSVISQNSFVPLPYVGGTCPHVVMCGELYEIFPTRSQIGPIVGFESVVGSITGEGRTVFVWTFNCLCIEDVLEI